MVKCPGTAEGIRVLRRLTAMGIATNCTLAFTLPQFVSVMDAVHSGLTEAKVARLYPFIAELPENVQLINSKVVSTPT